MGAEPELEAVQILVEIKKWPQQLPRPVFL
jgi:hypothetical protein